MLYHYSKTYNEKNHLLSENNFAGKMKWHVPLVLAEVMEESGDRTVPMTNCQLKVFLIYYLLLNKHRAFFSGGQCPSKFEIRGGNLTNVCLSCLLCYSVPASVDPETHLSHEDFTSPPSAKLSKTRAVIWALFGVFRTAWARDHYCIFHTVI